MADIQSIPKVFESFISQQCTEDIEILKLSKVNFMITQEEAHKDLDIFQYIMDNSYSGREYWQNHGVDFNKIYENIRSFINSHNQIHKSELYNLYYSQLKGIHDGHLSIMSHGTCGRFQCNYKAYFSDVLLEKIDDAYEVIYSSISDILVGNRFNLQQLEGKLFKTLSPTGKEHYLLGCRSWEAIDVITINNDNRIITLPVHPCKASVYMPDTSGIFKFSNVEGYSIVTSSRFWEWDAASEVNKADELYNCGLQLKDEQVVIWNLMGNGGGNSEYPMKFIKGLNDYAFWKINCAVLNSPSIQQAHGTRFEDVERKREWTFYCSEERDLSKGKFNGTLYVLCNDSVSSSGEAALNIARSIRNCIVIGQNSCGVGTFGDTLSYYLPYSDIYMSIPCKLFLGGAKEGEGLEPDYWVDRTDVQGELISWLKDPSAYQALK